MPDADRTVDELRKRVKQLEYLYGEELGRRKATEIRAENAETMCADLKRCLFVMRKGNAGDTRMEDKGQ